MSWLSDMFSAKRKGNVYSYTGHKPYASLKEATGGQQYYDELIKRMAGEGVGYGPEYVSQTTAPRTAYSRQLFQNYTMPELQSQLSASGRRKGSAGFSQVSQALGEQAGKEGDIYAQEYGMNEQQRRNEINQALSGVGEFASKDAELMNNLANFDQGVSKDEYNSSVQAAAGKTADRQRMYDNILKGGIAVTGAMAGMPASSGAFSAGNYGDLSSFWPKLKPYNPVSPSSLGSSIYSKMKINK